jgi:hypothetical protein
MKQQRILIAEAEGKSSLCFDTGLDPRSFARTKLSQCFTEPGYIVCPDSTVKAWNASNVFILDGFMRVWGPLFEGERLDLFINSQNDKALQAVIFWIRARLFLGDTQSILNPGAAFVALTGKQETAGSVLITPENLSNRCLIAEEDENDINPYLCPDLSGMDAAAFCAGTMLYRVFTGVHAFNDIKNIYQDMRDGLFIPPHFISYGMDEKLSKMIENALLLPVANKRKENGTAILNSLLTFLTENKSGGDVKVSSFIRDVSEEEKEAITAKKKQITGRTNAIVKTKRFITRYKAALYAAAAVVLFAIFVAWNVANTHAQLTTKGLDSHSVVTSYYEAFNTLNHTYMEACLSGADKSDVNVAVNYYAIDRMRQAYEMKAGTAIISAHVWKEMGGELPAPNVFGITDMDIEEISGYEEDNEMRYRAKYLLWFPNEEAHSDRTDDLTLIRKKGIWKITEIKRTFNY